MGRHFSRPLATAALLLFSFPGPPAPAQTDGALAQGAREATPVAGVDGIASDFRRQAESRFQRALPADARRPGFDGVTRPEKIRDAVPRYPDQAFRLRSPGQVALSILVDEHGEVAGIETVACDPCDLGFEDEAAAAVRRWRFQPALRLGRPVAVQDLVFFRFSNPAQTAAAVEEARLRQLEAIARSSSPQTAASLAGSEGITPPVRRRWKVPPYPRRARIRRVPAHVDLLVHVDSEGRIAAIVAATSDRSDYPFQAAVEGALKKFRYEPARRRDQAIEVLTWIMVEFDGRHATVREFHPGGRP